MNSLKPLFRSTLLFAFAIAISVSIPANVFAFQKAYDYELGHYSPNSVACSEAPLNGNDNLERVYNFMLGKQLKDIHAAAVVGNIAVEAAGAEDPLIVERNSSHPDLPKSTDNPASLPEVDGWPGGGKRQPGWGLIQWTPATKFTVVAPFAGVSAPFDLEKQLEVIWWHMTVQTPLEYTGNEPVGKTKFLENFTKTADLEAATRYYMEKMEGPYGDGHFANRLMAAEVALEYTKNPGLSGGCSVGGGGAVIGDVVQTAINYAHPEYHKPPYLTPTKAYADAVDAAEKKGEFIGGGNHKGIDCGGFVTRVMRNSSADPDYGGGGHVAIQYEYLRSSDKYEEIDPSGENTAVDGTVTNGVQPGDIAIQRNLAHTYLYIGKHEGFETEVASASYGLNRADGPWRAPMAGYEMPGDTDYYWFRLK